MSDKQQGQIVVQSTDLAAIGELERALLEGVAPVEVDRDPDDVSHEIIAQLLGATDDEQLERLEAEGWSPGPDHAGYLGVPMEIHGFVWRPSTFDEGQAVFLVVRTIDLRDGTPHVLTTGSGQVMAQLANLAKRDRLPAVRELAGTETKSQRKVYWLKTPDALAAERRQAALAAVTNADEPEPAA